MSYLPIRVSTLRGDQKIGFDTYVKINDKYILYLRSGDSFEGQRLKKLREKKLKKMYILPDAEDRYRSYLEKNIESAYDKQDKPMAIRAEIIQGAQQSNVEAIFDNIHDESAYSEAKGAVNKFVQFLQKEEDGLKSILNIENDDCNVAQHCVSVSALAVALAAKLNLKDPKQLQMLALGALLHDYEHTQSKQKLQGPISAMVKTELDFYYAHPKNGAQKVQVLRHFDAPVVNIMMEHEECIDGTGFPNGLSEKKCNPLSVIVSSANTFDRLVTFEGHSKKDAHKKLIVNQMGRHPLNHINFIGELI